MGLIIGVGTESALKIRATNKALTILQERGITTLGDLSLRGYTLLSGKTKSGIPDQPMGLTQMFRGALNRAQAACEAHDVHIGIGIENGLMGVDLDDGTAFWFDPPAVAVVYPRWRVRGLSLGAALPIPFAMVEEVCERDTELGHVIQKRAGGGEKDPHRFLSKGALDREEIIVQALLSAFTVLISADEYRPFNPND